MQEFLKTIIIESGALAKDYFYKGVHASFKANRGDLVTEADIAVEKLLVSRIQEKFPTHHIHTEESKEDINPGAEYEWVIDPIDGTRNFAMGISFWCQLIAVMKNGEPYLATVYNPLSNELFFAEKGKGAFLNNKRITVNTTDSLDFCFGCIVRDTANDTGGFKKMASRFITETKGWLHNFGTMLSACHLAMGGVDFFAINCGYDHDYLAPMLICSEAGAKVTDSKGEAWQRGQRDLVIANPKLHPQIMKLFS
ncbi:MAG TPA: inositol monophosphatase [Patescibacteria group bacterium]|nr:inositol monophosphatase [Patescibacteria group bacterium]